MRTLDFAALLTAPRRDGAGSHALVPPLGMTGLRVGETCRIDIGDLRQQAGYELLTVLGKGNEPAVIPVPVPVLRAVRDATAGRSSGPLLLNSKGQRLRPAAAAAQLRRRPTASAEPIVAPPPMRTTSRFLPLRRRRLGRSRATVTASADRW